MSWEQAAATPVSFVTAHDALTRAGALQAGEVILVQGASSNTGIAVVQIARLKAARIFGTAGSAHKMTRLHSLGCEVTINYREKDFIEVICEMTQSRGADMIVDLVGGNAAQGHILSSAINGRIICVGRLGGPLTTIDLDEFSRRQLTMIGVTFRTRSMEQRIAAVRSFSADILPALGRGSIHPIVDSVYPLSEVAAAQERMRANKHFGKIVLMT